MPAIIHASVAILQEKNGHVLLAKRPDGKPWAGWWEFPGGKIEIGESPIQALTREIKEELGVNIISASPWLKRVFQYPEKTVQLHFFMVTEWQGEPRSVEGQTLSWQNPASLNVNPVLPANIPIVASLALPAIYAISNAKEMGDVVFFERLKKALARGIQLIQVREVHLSADAFRDFSKRILTMATPYQAKVLINSNIHLAREIGASGVHFTSEELMHLQEKPAGILCAASCHNAIELAQAEKLGLDFVVLSPILATKSHPEATPLGWRGCENLLKNYSLPVYVLGGMTSNDERIAWQNGARGVAMMRAVWD